MIHRNTYINGPTVLRDTWQTRARPDLFFAGQVSGVEGYVESAASGLIAGRNAARLVARARPPVRAAAHDGDWRARRTTCRTPIPRTTSRRTSRSASCRRSRRRRSARQDRPLATSDRALAELDAGSSDDARQMTPEPDCARRCALLTRADRARSSPSSSYNRNLSPHTVRAYDTDLLAAARHPGRAAHGCKPSELTLEPSTPTACAAISGSCTSAASAARRRRGSWRRCARSPRYLIRDGLLDDDPTALVGSPRKRADAAGAPRRRRHGRLLEAPDASTVGRPPRSRHSRAVLRVRPATERARATSISRTSTWPAASCACAARAARSGWCRSIGATAEAIRTMLADRRAALRRSTSASSVEARRPAGRAARSRSF